MTTTLADWSTCAAKRWGASAPLQPDDRYLVSAPRLVVRLLLGRARQHAVEQARGPRRRTAVMDVPGPRG